MIYQGKARYPITGLVLHCTATPPDWRKADTSQQRVEAIRQMHIKERGWANIGYHWLIDRDGTLLPGRPETEIGAHVAGHNSGTLGISLFGGLASKPGDLFGKNYTPAQASTLQRIIADIRLRASIQWIKGHNEFDAGKACPGFRVPDWLRAVGISL